MTTDDIVERIRKLIRLAEDAGATHDKMGTSSSSVASWRTCPIRRSAILPGRCSVSSMRFDLNGSTCLVLRHVGDRGPNSDIDLLVVVDETDKPMYRLDQQGYGVLEPYRLPIELVFITRSDFERRLPAVASLPATVVREGRLLYAA